MAGTVQALIAAIRDRTVPLIGARHVYDQLADQLSQDERAMLLDLMASWEVEEGVKKVKPSLLQLIPDGWLKDYMQLTAISEAPVSFHFFNAMAMLSHFIGRRMFYPVGLFNIYPLLNIFFVSPAGKATRSTASEAAMRVGKYAGASVLSGRFTPEGALDWARNNPNSILYTDEAGTVLNKSEYMAQMPQVLVKLIDGAPFDMKLKGSNCSIPPTAINVIFGCAPEWFATTLPKASMGGGLLSRFLLVYEDKKSKLLARPSDGAIDYESTEMLIRQLGTQLRLLIESMPITGRVTFTPEAGKAHDKWYEDNNKALEEADEDKMAVYYARKQAHLIRLCMLLLACQHGRMAETYKIDSITHDTALAILATIEEGMKKVYGVAGQEKDSQVQARILAVLDKQQDNQIGHSDLMRKTGFSAAVLRQTLAGMMEFGLVKPGFNGKRMMYIRVKSEET